MVYLPSFLVPSQNSIDMSQPNTFSAQVNAQVVDSYQIIIKKVSDNSVLYDSTKKALTTNLYDKQTFSVTIPANTVTFRGNIKWTLSLWNGSETVTSNEISFYNQSIPTLTFTVPSSITKKAYTFNATYSQAENIPVKRWSMSLFDSNGKLLKFSGDNYSSFISYAFDGFDSNQTYKISLTVENQLGVVVSTTQQSFSVSYSVPSIVVLPTATQLTDKSAVQIDWLGANQNLGIINGTSSYISDFLKTGNTAIQINSNSDLTYSTFIIPQQFTGRFTVQLPVGFKGIIWSTLDNNYKIGYEDDRFYYIINGNITYLQTMPLSVGNNTFIIAIRPMNILIRRV